jgi:hypothetical protein
LTDKTPQKLRCEWGGCQSIHALDDGRRYIIVGQTAGLVADDELVAKPGPDETAVIIDHALLATIRDEVRRDCVRAIEAELAKERGGYDPSKEYTAGQMHEAYFTAGHRAIAAICALKETPHD